MAAGKEQVNKAMKGEKASGLYFPIAAVQVGVWAGTGLLRYCEHPHCTPLSEFRAA